jgi:hypothetical protein
LYQTIETGDSYIFERYYKTKKLWLEVSVYSSGTGFSVYLKDITDRKAAHFKLKELNEQLHLKAKELHQKNVKPNFFHFFIKPFYKFFLTYFIRLGFLDGKNGIVICYLNALSVYKRYPELKRLISNENR